MHLCPPDHHVHPQHDGRGLIAKTIPAEASAPPLFTASEKEFSLFHFDRLEDLYPVLHHPGAAFRALPFRGWSARQEPDALLRQIADMKDMGMGGAFIHSGEGLETPCLSEE